MSLAPELDPGPLFIDVAGHSLNEEDRELISHPLTGGVILFSRNYLHSEQLIDLIRQMRASRRGPLLIAVDQEGGRVQRFKEGFTSIPPMRRFGELYDQHPQQACSRLMDASTLLARELRNHGVDFSFAPVADLDRGLCPAIGDRALHATVDGVSELALTVINGFRAAGCASVIKHFPGHGSVDVDPHDEFAKDNRSMAEISAEDMQTFATLSTHATAVMLAHVVFEQVDAAPATLSKVWQQLVLRQQLGFTGPILTDDLSMGAITGRMSQADAAAEALRAGSDLALICNDRKAAVQAFDHPHIQVGSSEAISRRKTLIAVEGQPPEHSILNGASE